MPSHGHGLLEQAKLDNAMVGFSTLFNRQLGLAAEPLAQLAMRIPSSNAGEDFYMLGDVPMLEEWLDDRKFSSLRAEKVSIRNRDFASGLRVHRNDIMDDRLGMVEPQIQRMADRARQHVTKSLVELLLNGFDGNDFPAMGDGLAYDGQFFFSASHQEGGGPAQDNVSTDALDADSYEAARTQMMSLVDEASQPLDINPTTLIVGPANERTALEVVQAGLIDSGGAAVDNVFRGTANVIVSRRLVGTYANYWFLVDTSAPIKPLIWLDREAPKFVAQDRLDDEHAFMRNQFRYGVQYRGGYGYGLWQFIHGSTGAS